ncbi:nucleoid-associated protein NdpA [Oceanimonas sp. GK1]|uniref:nucleoid-associated protein YejK n=1 Tax=Oceanimonas sp. (strain GK1 / IBRC-M 10197) TaxID=511062 RepID=UPI00024954B9|nr:nucleoid-associated protein YejK [Oceanimonas sp. GK1]AEY01045.1 nucleoid-associated protein NdpA [Oceanimonas sp. GK1]
MSLDIEHIIVHSLFLNEQGQTELAKRDDELATGPAVTQLMSELHHIYNTKAGKVFGYFSDEDTGFRDLVRRMEDQSLGFAPFSHLAAERLLGELNRLDMQEEGVLLCVRYQWLGAHYLLIALLDNKDSVTVTDQLDVSRASYLDLGRMQLAARLDLTELRTRPESKRYFSFIKGRAGRKVSDFFLNFLSCVEGMDPKAQSQGLMKAVEEYCDARQLSKEEKQESKTLVSKYCREQLKEGEELELRELSAELGTDDDLDFYQFVSEEYELEERFPVDRSSLKGLTKYVGSGGGLTISFDQKLLGERIQYDAATDTLVIRGTPPNLKAQLQGNRE